MSGPIPREAIVDIYRLFDALAGSIILAGGFYGLGHHGRARNALNESDRIADQIERAFSAILTPEERDETDEDTHPQASGRVLRPTRP